MTRQEGHRKMIEIACLLVRCELSTTSDPEHLPPRTPQYMIRQFKRAEERSRDLSVDLMAALKAIEEAQP
jgi:hypothetical protein